MKTFIPALFLCIASLASCQNKKAAPELTPADKPTKSATPLYKVITPADFAAKIKEQTDLQLVDVRRPNEFAEGHIEGAVNIDFFGASFNSDFSKLDKEKPVLLYCRSGKRSGASSKKLVAMGFSEIYDLKGGFLAWMKTEGGN